jgi:hypothetical protein
MKDLTFGTLIAVFEEMFGAGLFWAHGRGAAMSRWAMSTC